MTDKIKQEVLNQLALDIKLGFENEKQLFTSIREMFYQERDFDENWLRNMIFEKFQKYKSESISWKHPTDFEKLVKTFDELIIEKIVCIHNAGYTQSEAKANCLKVIDQLNELGIKAIGFCYYHSQDMERAVDPKIRNLYLGFDTPTQNDHEALQVANKIVDKLRKHGFDVAWTGTIDQRIDIKNINWKKLPYNQEWGEERVIQILTRKKNDKNHFGNFGISRMVN